MSAASWTIIAERGSLWGMRLTAAVFRLAGRRVTSVLVAVIVTYFFLTDRRGRAASLAYLRRVYSHPEGARVLGHPPTLFDTLRHYLEFGLAGIDRLRFAMGAAADVQFVVHGEEALIRLVERGEGGVLVGAHLGSFDALRALASRAGVIVNIVMSTRHAARLASVLGVSDDSRSVRIFDIEFAGPQAVFELRACVARGEFVALLADRVGPGIQARPVRAKFLGAEAPFPRGPFVLAAALQCPIALLLGVRSGARRYDIYVERLSGASDATPAGRRTWVIAAVADYARRLEGHCVRTPFQWFNFFDFWDEQPREGRAAIA